jgi:hypothetical protein
MGGEFAGTVLEDPRGDWVRGEARVGGDKKAIPLWFNLKQLTAVVPDPPADFGEQRWRLPACN